jgi:uncharacterized protein (TIGR01777 family)
VDVFEKSVEISVSANECFDWHLRPGAFERLCPPWEPVQVESRDSDVIRDGSRVVIRVPMGPITRRWVAEHRGFQPGRQFQDVQISGPFAHWEHTHRVEALGNDQCRLTDRIEYRLPLGVLGQFFGGSFVRKKLDTLFSYRHRVTAEDLTAAGELTGRTSMRVAISGATGLIGSNLCALLASGGHQVERLTRPGSRKAVNGPSAGDISWDPAARYIDASKLEGVDAVVHLAGDNVGSGRWSAAKKARIRDSRVVGTTLLCETLAQLQRPPSVLVCASAVGYYGNRGDELLDEKSSPANDFLGTVCQEWEACTTPARNKGIRVVNLRFGVVLSPRDGALAKMLFPFKMGGGGVLGPGTQYMPWIAIDDAIGAAAHALANSSLNGPVNAVAPNPVTNLEFTKTLGKVLSRPTILPMPAFAARLAFGEMADALLLASTRVSPQRLQETGYKFRFPELEPALRHLLGK